MSESPITDHNPRFESDAELARCLSLGEQDALQVLSTRYTERLRRFLAPMLDDDGQVDDMIQEVFVRAFRAAPKLGGWRSSLPAWIFRIAHNAAVDEIRSRKIHHRALIALRRRVTHVVVESPLDDLERQEFRRAFESKVRELPSSFREAFLLREVEGLDYEEIAAITGSNEKTVSSRLHRARRRLRISLASWIEDEK